MSRYDEVLKMAEEHAKEHDHNLNPDKKIVEAIIKGLIRNEEKHGEIYCPCRVVDGNEDEKKICPCFWHDDEIKKMGHCLCKLFVAKNE